MQLHQISKIFGNDNAQLVKQHLASMPVEFLVEMAVFQYSESEILNLIKVLTNHAEGLQLEDEPVSSEWIDVQSSNIEAIRYNAKSQSLDIRFYSSKDHSFYSYEGVPQFVFEGFMSAESKGRYFHDCIREDFKTSKQLLSH